jgi:hypothetical protein
MLDKEPKQFEIFQRFMGYLIIALLVIILLLLLLTISSMFPFLLVLFS